MSFAPACARREEMAVLPTMATHGCAPQHHRSQTDDGLVVTEECTRCGYRISCSPAGRDRLLPASRPAYMWASSAPSPTFTGRQRHCGVGRVR